MLSSTVKSPWCYTNSIFLYQHIKDFIEDSIYIRFYLYRNLLSKNLSIYLDLSRIKNLLPILESTIPIILSIHLSKILYSKNTIYISNILSIELVLGLKLNPHRFYLKKVGKIPS